MPNKDVVREDGTFFRIILTYGQQPFLADVGNLFQQLAADYTRETGRALALRDLKSGSIYAVFQDALAACAPVATQMIEYMKATNAIYGFSRMLRDAYSLMETGIIKKERGGNSIVAALEVITNSQCVIEFDYSSTSGERIGFKITPGDAVRIEDRARRPLLRPKSPKKKRKKTASSANNDRQKNPATQGEIATSPERRLDAVDSNSEEVRSLARTLVDALKKAGLPGEAIRIMHLSQRMGMNDLSAAINSLTKNDQIRRALKEHPEQRISDHFGPLDGPPARKT